MTDRELFNSNFGKWLEAHGVVLNEWKESKGFTATIDLNKLKPSIMRLSNPPDNPNVRCTEHHSCYQQGVFDGFEECLTTIKGEL